MIEKKFNNVDIVVRIRPKMDSMNYEWTGEIDISIISFPDNPLDDEDYSQLMHFTKMMCASVPIMENSQVLRDAIHDYVMEMEDAKEEEEKEENTLVITGEDGNIVHLDFSSKTKGSA